MKIIINYSLELKVSRKEVKDIGAGEMALHLRTLVAQTGRPKFKSPEST